MVFIPSSGRKTGRNSRKLPERKPRVARILRGISFPPATAVTRKKVEWVSLSIFGEAWAGRNTRGEHSITLVPRFRGNSRPPGPGAVPVRPAKLRAWAQCNGRFSISRRALDPTVRRKARKAPPLPPLPRPLHRPAMDVRARAPANGMTSIYMRIG